MEYSFDVNHAEKYGVEEAILIRHFKFWIEKNAASEKNQHDGRTWTYMAIEGFCKIFPFWTKKQIRRIVQSLVKQGIIITGNYNTVKYDHTIWYAFSDESNFLNEKFDLPKRENQIAQKGKPIPDILTDTVPDKYAETQIKSKRANAPSLPEELSKIEGLGRAWEDWLEHRRSMKKPVTPISARLSFKALGVMVDPVGAIERSIRNGYQGIFEDKFASAPKQKLPSAEELRAQRGDGGGKWS